MVITIMVIPGKKRDLANLTPDDRMKVSTQIKGIVNAGSGIIALIILSTSFKALNLFAQTNDIKFEHVSLEQGLSQSSVYSILQDSRGFMWFATADGLNKYDGYRFTVYKAVPDNFNSLTDNDIRSIYEDKSGTLWIGTSSGGLNKFDREKEQFSHYKHDPNDAGSLSSNYIWSIYEDKSGTLWIGTYGAGLNKFDREKKQFSHYKHDPNDPGSLSSNYVTSIYEDPDQPGVLWIGTSGGLDKFDREKNRFSHYQHDDNNPNSLSHRMVWSIYGDSSGTLWIGTYSGLNKFDRANEQFVHYKHDPKDHNSLSNNDVRSIYEDKAGTVWIGTYGGGLDQFDPGKKTFTHYQHARNNPHSLSDNSVVSMYEDQSGILWIGTYAGGLNKFDRAKKHISHYQHDPNNPNSLSNNDIKSIYEDKSGTIWIGTFAGGLTKFDREKERFSHYQHDPDDPNSLTDNYVMAICEDQSGILWIGTFAGGLNKFDGTTERFSHYQHDPNDVNSLGYGSVMSIYEDKSGTVWIGTSYGGLNKLVPPAPSSSGSPNEGSPSTFIRYQHDPNDPNSLSNNAVWSIYEAPDKPGILWVGTLGGGLNKFDQENETFTRYKHDPDDLNSLSNDDIRSIYEDKLGAMWIGTSRGLNQFDRAEETFTHYREKDGLPNDVIYGILEDNEGYLWLSTNKGLAKFTPPNSHLRRNPGLVFRNYDVNDGLQSNEFNANAYCKSRSGEVLFGGVNGINAFYPSDIKDSPHVPPIVLTDFQIFNESVLILGENDRSPLQKHITETDEITLSYKASVFSFEFAALHYAFPERNQYAYKMEGFDEDWVYSGNRRFATYTNLDPDDYVFRIKGSNKDNVWNEAGTSVKITITPPFWKTWWFKIFSVASILALAFGWYSKRIKSIELQKQQLEVQVAEKTKKMRLILEGTASATGNDFFRLLVRNLGSLLGVRYVFVSELTEVGTRVRTMAFWSTPGFLDNVEYDLAGTPCEKILSGDVCHYMKDVQALFPDDQDLVDLGAESYIAIPLTTRSGHVLGHLAVLDDKPMPVESQDLSILRTFAARAGAELERKQADEALKHRSDIELIISTISTSFINLEPKEVDETINYALLTLGSFAGVDRSYVFLFSEDEKTFSNTHEWCAEGIESSISSSLDLPTKVFPRVMATFKQFEAFYVPCVASLPQEESILKGILRQQGVQSLINVPLVSGKRLIGFLGFDAVRAQKKWSEEDIRMLKFVSEIFVNALERIRAEKELQKTQAQLVQSEKMAALGKLTAGISHEINTPVGVVKSAMDTQTRCGQKIDEILKKSKTLTELKKNTDYQKALEILKSNRLNATVATDRILKMVTSLKNFVQLDEAELKKMDIHEGLDSTLTLINPELKGGTRIIKNYGDMPQIYGYAAEINQVFMTILRNASQAIEGTGTITIETFAEEANAHIKIADTGKGLPSERVATLFDLNFTTNGSRVGMGMGLFNAYNTIQKHKGEIEIESKVGKGSTITITLPTSLEKTIDLN